MDSLHFTLFVMVQLYVFLINYILKVFNDTEFHRNKISILMS